MKVAYSSNNVIVNDIKRTCSKQAKPTIQENGNKNQDLTLFLLEFVFEMLRNQPVPLRVHADPAQEVSSARSTSPISS